MKKFNHTIYAMLLFLAVAFLPTTVNGAVIVDNGPLVNSPGSGFGGADESVLQNVSLGMNILGFGHRFSNNETIADDFTIADATILNTIDFFSYQSFSPATSMITSVVLRIWDGVPGAGGTVIFGDLSTNLLVNTTFSNIYRVVETNMGGTERPIMRNTVDLGGLTLAAGTYWLEWQVDGSAAFSGPWAPPITITGQTTTGNALQSTDNGVTFNPVIDTNGTNTPQGFPFIINGEIVAVPTMGEWGLFLFMLIVLTMGVVFVQKRQVQLAGGASLEQSTSFKGGFSSYLPFDAQHYVSMIPHALGCAVVGFALIWVFWGEITVTDLVGMMVSLPLFTYFLHVAFPKK